MIIKNIIPFLTRIALLILLPPCLIRIITYNIYVIISLFFRQYYLLILLVIFYHYIIFVYYISLNLSPFSIKKEVPFGWRLKRKAFSISNE